MWWLGISRVIRQSLSRSPPKWEEKQNTLLNRRKRKLSEKSGPWDYRNRSIWEKYFPRGQMPSARQKRHQTVSIKLADCQDSCRVFVLTSRSDHVIVYATAKLIMDGGLPNYRPTRLNDSGHFFRPLTKNRRFFHIYIFYLNSPNHALHSCILLGVFLVGKSYWISIFNFLCNSICACAILRVRVICSCPATSPLFSHFANEKNINLNGITCRLY